MFEFLAISRTILKAKAQYARAYLATEKDDFDLTYFILYNLDAIDTALKEFYAYLDRKKQEQKEAVHLIQTIKGINLRQSLIIKELFEKNNKPITIKEIQNKYKVVYQTAREDLLNLESLGIVTKVKMQKKLVFFKSHHFEEKLKIHQKQ